MIAVNPDRTRCPYEVGDILQTINSMPPAQRWPGTQWQQITDRFVRGADAQHPAGSTGGSWTHTQTAEEVASHYHERIYGVSGSQELTFGEGLSNAYNRAGISNNTGQPENQPYSSTAYTGNAGESQPMDITNPYYSAYIWLRTG